MARGEVVTIQPESVADGLGAPFAGGSTLAMARRLPRRHRPARRRRRSSPGLRFALERLKQVLEPAGAAALAAVLAGRIPIRDGERVAVVLSGRERRGRAARRAARGRRDAARGGRLGPTVGAGRRPRPPATPAIAPGSSRRAASSARASTCSAARPRRCAGPRSTSASSSLGTVAPLALATLGHRGPHRPPDRRTQADRARVLGPAARLVRPPALARRSSACWSRPSRAGSSRPSLLGGRLVGRPLTIRPGARTVADGVLAVDRRRDPRRHPAGHRPGRHRRRRSDVLLPDSAARARSSRSSSPPSLVGAPFAYVLAGVVLGDVGAGRGRRAARSASIGPARSRPSSWPCSRRPRVLLILLGLERRPRPRAADVRRARARRRLRARRPRRS